ncbi:MAG: acyl-CoA thioesterase [bacterium]|nr:acyl-CoA thioesterase [bacterium]
MESVQTVASFEMDSFGHVNNSVFLNYLERARGDFLESKGLRFADFFRWQRYPIVARANLEFKMPAKAGDRLLVKGTLTARTATTFTLRYTITNMGNDKIVLTGETFHVFVDDNNRPSRIPEEFLEKFIDS